ncbi:MAG: 4-hydroxy-3-methylbut-2-en-1-yl diphosphate synthase [Bradymonadales bacterium]|nr:MAG: 4-hydroxy-3-methylbut-2-en-1-yl diphosphate synthase [Bradymonadales bacterium]
MPIPKEIINSSPNFRRFKTREIQIGNRVIGGDAPILVQSMTTTDTCDVEATVKQVIELVEVGCDIVRITAPTPRDAQALQEIRKTLDRRGVSVPLVADIHFMPKAAMIAVDWVEKVRINPGNFADRKLFKVMEYSDSDYQRELDRIHDSFKPLVMKLKERGAALRIGTNHGSLSDRIMNRFGDTPEGMIQSAFEYAEICRLYDFHNFCFSMKASNVSVMMQAYRLLVERQMERAWDYPIHLGVTEAGDGEDARIKSAIGIGTLLAEGIGDTIRVSLTEHPVREIPVARELAERFNKSVLPYPAGFDFVDQGGANSVVPEVWIREQDFDFSQAEKLSTTVEPPDVIFFDSPVSQRLESDFEAWKIFLKNDSLKLALPYRLRAELQAFEPLVAYWLADPKELDEREIRDERVKQCVSSLEHLKGVEDLRPESLVFSYQLSSEKLSELSDLCVQAGSAFIDLPLSGLMIQGLSLNSSLRINYAILQATRRRMSKTEYIACPSCGRTLFDLEETTARIRERTDHLKGVKIAIMGCIVNGPGEMADADFGYVGGAPGRVNLYVGKDCVQKNIPSKEAPERLVQLIKDHGRWVEAPRETVV